MRNRRRNDDEMDEDAQRDWLRRLPYAVSWPVAFCFVGVFAVLATGGMEIAWRLGYPSDQGAFDVVVSGAIIGTPIIVFLGAYLLQRRRG
jgi:hypothetical protein